MVTAKKTINSVMGFSDNLRIVVNLHGLLELHVDLVVFYYTDTTVWLPKTCASYTLTMGEERTHR